MRTTAIGKVAADPAQQRMIAIRCHVIAMNAGGVVDADDAAAALHHDAEILEILRGIG